MTGGIGISKVLFFGDMMNLYKIRYLSNLCKVDTCHLVSWYALEGRTK